MPDTDRSTRLDDLRAETLLGGGEERMARQHEKGKLTARERLDVLLDPGSFEELGTFVRHRSTDFGLEDNRPYGDGVVTGFGTIEGRVVYIFSQVLHIPILVAFSQPVHSAGILVEPLLRPNLMVGGIFYPYAMSVIIRPDKV